MEYVKSGELFDYIVEKGRLGEAEALRFFQQIVSGVEYAHRNMVVHRDLKPENLLLDSRLNVKIADFGLSNVMRDGHFLKTSCGSPNYAAPEVISGRLYAGPEVDVWSCGVILYALLCGSLPFDDENIPNLFKKIKGAIYTLPHHLSAGARDLIPRMLFVDPLKRITIPEIRQHPWFSLHLPRYLAVPPPDTITQAQKLDAETLESVVKTGFDRQMVIDSLRQRLHNKATVAYYLILDNRRRIQSGYLGSEMGDEFDKVRQQGKGDELGRGAVGSGRTTSSSSLQNRMIAERHWTLGIQTRRPPAEMMTEVFRTLQSIGVGWKRTQPYTVKCRQQLAAATTSHPPSSVLTHLQSGAAPPSVGGPSTPQNPAAPHPADPLVATSATTTPPSGVQDMSHAITTQHLLVKFEVQLYRLKEERYAVDIQRLEGPLYCYMDLVNRFISELKP
eukprot:CAMPEP_0196572784 /NCGR_PEP_ID=MMETSP1081-20130531/2766_1 /TAXON_ID=36882 /ORGANISM="Pyramimonas amylifera, Strain CCMP720" /LENGTH=446 /DNA_ID=CAMNT_0041890217 /DNA_START=123 /DNA_END=1463 /DNA_ORIENTATION=+